jgi:hypothetical protein
MVVGSLPPPFRAFPPYLAPLAATGGAFFHDLCLDALGSPSAAFCELPLPRLAETLADSLRANCESWPGHLSAAPR